MVKPLHICIEVYMYISDFRVDKASPLPYYYQLERFIQSLIDKGYLKKLDELKAEGEIASLCNISVGVVRHALKRLEQSGAIIRRKGKRAVVKGKQKIQVEFSQKQYGGYKELEKQGFKVNTKVIYNTLTEPEVKVKEKLKINKGDKIIKIIRIRSIEDQPVIFWISYVPFHLCPDLAQYDLTDCSLNSVVYELYGIRTNSVECSLEVIRGEQEICRLLNKPLDEPLIYIESTNFLEDERVFQLTEAWHTSDNWSFNFHLLLNKSRMALQSAD